MSVLKLTLIGVCYQNKGIDIYFINRDTKECVFCIFFLISFRYTIELVTAIDFFTIFRNTYYTVFTIFRNTYFVIPTYTPIEVCCEGEGLGNEHNL